MLSARQGRQKRHFVSRSDRGVERGLLQINGHQGVFPDLPAAGEGSDPGEYITCGIETLRRKRQIVPTEQLGVAREQPDADGQGGDSARSHGNRSMSQWSTVGKRTGTVRK